MNYKFLTVFSLMILMSVTAVAQNSSNSSMNETVIEASPGMIDAESPLYGLEVAFDNAAVNVGLKQAGDIAQERAAEARKAQDNGNSQAAQRAADNVQKVSEEAKDSDEEGVSRAMEMMRQTISDAPNDEARSGMQNALENMEKAQEKRNAARGQSDQIGPDSERAERGNQAQRENQTEEDNVSDRDNQSDAETVNETEQDLDRDNNTEEESPESNSDRRSR